MTAAHTTWWWWVRDLAAWVRRSARRGTARAWRSCSTDRWATRTTGRLVKSYAVEILVDGRWRMVVEEDENFLRHRIHAIPETEIPAVRVTVAETWGDPSARLFEIRVY